MRQDKKGFGNQDYGFISGEGFKSMKDNQKEIKTPIKEILSPTLDVNLEASRKLVALSHKRKHQQQSLLNFADPQDHNALFFTIKNVRQTDDIATIKSKTYIAPELKDYQDPLKLPTFLREKISQESSSIQKSQSKKPKEFMVALEKPESHTRTKSVEMKKSSQGVGKMPRESILKSRAEELLSQMSNTHKSTKKEEIIDYQYLSPKARQEMNSKKMPILMTSVFLTGMVNPEGVSPKNETTVEYIISEHHGKANTQQDAIIYSTFDKKRTNSKKSLALNLVEQNKKVKKRFGSPKETRTDTLPYFETQIVAAVDQLKSEREKRKEKVLRVLKTRNFNLFKPSTINNMHLLKDALRED